MKILTAAVMVAIATTAIAFKFSFEVDLSDIVGFKLSKSNMVGSSGIIYGYITLIVLGLSFGGITKW